MTSRPSAPLLQQRVRTLALTSPPATSLFYARLYYALFPPAPIDYSREVDYTGQTTPPEHDSLHVLAACLLAAGEPYSALHLVQDRADIPYDTPEPGRPAPAWACTVPPPCFACAVLVGRACAATDRYSEGQTVLERVVRRVPPVPLPIVAPPEVSPTLLLARLAHNAGDSIVAKGYYARALADEPWLWEAYVAMCDLGGPPSLEATFPDPPRRPPRARHPASPGPMPRSSASEVPNFLSRRQFSPVLTPAPAPMPMGNGLFTPEAGLGLGPGPARALALAPQLTFDSPSIVADSTFALHSQAVPGANGNGNGNGNGGGNGNGNGNGARRGLFNMLPAALRSTPTTETPELAKPATKRARAASVLRKQPETPGPLAGESRTNGRDLRLVLDGSDKDAPPRRSSRLNTTTTNKATAGTGAGRLAVARDRRATRSQSVQSAASVASVASSASGHDAASAIAEAAAAAAAAIAVDEWLRDIVRRCARAYRFLSMFQCRKALDEVDALAPRVGEWAWSLDIVARCFSEMGNHAESCLAFRKLRRLEPFRLEHMEIYSTSLWHVNNALELSSLSQELLAINREAPQPWIASGNTFSLQGDHEQAMRCFRRAAQLEPACAYAWTLCGHEATELDELDRAIVFFRTAIRADSQTANAWYGMGLVYMRMGKLRHAEHHYRRAIEINPCNPALLCCRGTILEKLKNLPGALAVYEQAGALDAKNSSMAHYNRARVLVALHRVPEAITVLEDVVRKTPDEANVHFLLGKCYLRTNRAPAAIHALTVARELQPKLENAIRATMLAHGAEEAEEAV